jgi:hypothetical protein
VIGWYYLGVIAVFEYGRETVWWWDGLLPSSAELSPRHEQFAAASVATTS